MKLTLKNLFIALATAGLLLPACKKGEDAPEPAAQEATAEAAPAEEEAEAAPEEQAQADEEAAEEAPVEVNEDMYIKAAYEVTCVNAKLDDPARAGEIKQEIYARYGFTEESFVQAEEALKDRESVKMAVSTRMESCTAELAAKLGEAGAEVAEAETEEAAEEAAEETAQAKKPAPKPTPAKVGGLRARNISGGAFEGAELRLNVRADFKVSGEFRGKREGAQFVIPVSGEVAKNGELRATGERQGNSVALSGKLTSAGASGSLQGSVHQKPYNVTFNAQ